MKTSPSDLRRRHGSMPVTGPDTVTVPGVLSSWEEISRLGANLSLAPALEHAARLADEGVDVAPSLARAIADDSEMIAADPGMSELFGPDRAEGDLLLQPALADTLRRLASGGVERFYDGDVGREFIAGIKSLGSQLEVSDLAAHRTELPEPLTDRAGGFEIFTAPPASQGFVLLQILACLEESSGLAEDPCLLARLFAACSAERDAYLADREFMEVTPRELLDADHVSALLERVEVGEPNPTSSRPRPSGDTVAVVAVDSDGRAISLIQSVFHSFGSGLLEPNTGIVCHNRGACFSLEPESPNLIAGGKKPAHTLMPVLIRDADGAFAAHGTMGGKAQPQIHAQLLLARAAGLTLTESISRPRFVVGSPDAGGDEHVLIAEPTLEEGVLSKLRQSEFKLEITDGLDELVGHAQAVSAFGGDFQGASDPRADGSAVLVERPEVKL